MPNKPKPPHLSASYATYICENDECRKPFLARAYKRNKGWARFCCKSCAGQTQARLARDATQHDDVMHTLDAAWRGIASIPQTHQNDDGDAETQGVTQ